MINSSRPYTNPCHSTYRISSFNELPRVRVTLAISHFVTLHSTAQHTRRTVGKRLLVSNYTLICIAFMIYSSRCRFFVVVVIWSSSGPSSSLIRYLFFLLHQFDFASHSLEPHKTHNHFICPGLIYFEFHQNYFVSFTHAIASIAEFSNFKPEKYDFLTCCVTVSWCVGLSRQPKWCRKKMCEKSSRKQRILFSLVFRNRSNAFIISRTFVFLVWSSGRIWEVRKYNDTFVLFRINSVSFRNILRNDRIHLTDVQQRPYTSERWAVSLSTASGKCRWLHLNL